MAGNFAGRWDEMPSGCWDWNGPLGRGGYGQFWDRDLGRPRKAHRYALELHTGIEPDRWTFACHHCDNRKCVNPAHLYWGTPAENVADMVSRGRASKGRPPTVPASQWPGIMRAREAGESYRLIASRHGVSGPAIWKIVQKATGSADATH